MKTSRVNTEQPPPTCKTVFTWVSDKVSKEQLKYQHEGENVELAPVWKKFVSDLEIPETISPGINDWLNFLKEFEVQKLKDFLNSIKEPQHNSDKCQVNPALTVPDCISQKLNEIKVLIRNIRKDTKLTSKLVQKFQQLQTQTQTLVVDKLFQSMKSEKCKKLTSYPEIFRGFMNDVQFKKMFFDHHYDAIFKWQASNKASKEITPADEEKLLAHLKFIEQSIFDIQHYLQRALEWGIGPCNACVELIL